MKKYIATGAGFAILTTSMYFLFFFSSTPLYGNTCKWSEVKQCRDINRNNGDPRSLDFECPQSSDEVFQAYQVVLDKNFQDLDDEIDQYLEELQNDKSRYYGGDITYLDAYDDVSKKLGFYGEYSKKYKDLCNIGNPDGIAQQTIACLGGSSPITSLSGFTEGSDCTNMVNAKLDVYKGVAEKILYRNKAQIVTDRQTKYSVVEKSTYSKLLDLFTYNIGIIQKISNKWISKNAENGVPQ